jgi:hypothetical protein
VTINQVVRAEFNAFEGSKKLKQRITGLRHKDFIADVSE